MRYSLSCTINGVEHRSIWRFSSSQAANKAVKTMEAGLRAAGLPVLIERVTITGEPISYEEREQMRHDRDMTLRARSATYNRMAAE